MTRKHYEMFAQDWGKYLATLSQDEYEVAYAMVWAVLSAFEIDNPSFDRVRFLTRIQEVIKEYSFKYSVEERRWIPESEAV